MAMGSLKPFLTILFFASAVTFASGGAIASEQLEKFFGSYVGSGTAQRLSDNVTEQRDLDVTVEAYKNNGFTLKWITVVRGADGERAGDDVKRREVEENFVPLEDKENVFILAPKGGLFQKSELPNPLLGAPMRWATIENETMTVYSMKIGDSGASELQVYRRMLTEKGMDVSFLRLHDESVELEMKGTLVRAE